MELRDYRDAFLKLGFMAELTHQLRQDTVEVLIQVGKLRSVPKGGLWIREGEHTTNKGYVLLQGTVCIQKSGHPDIECEAPELLGEMMQFNPAHSRTATIKAMTDCIVMRFIWDDFWDASKQYFSSSDQEELKNAVESCAWSHFAS